MDQDGTKKLVEGNYQIAPWMIEEKWRFYCCAVENNIYKKRYQAVTDSGFFLITGNDFLIVADDEGTPKSIERLDVGNVLQLTFTNTDGTVKNCKVTVPSAEIVKTLTTERTTDNHVLIKLFTEEYPESTNIIQNPHLLPIFK